MPRMAKKKKRLRRLKRRIRLFFRKLTKFFFVLSIWCGIGLAAAGVYMLHDVPDVNALQRSERHIGVRFFDRMGREFSYDGNHIGNAVQTDALPEHFIDALLATEDRRFYGHFGVDVFGILRAAVKNMRAGRIVEGGSTITQQLAKLSFLTPERTFKRKLQEMYLAIYLDAKFDKDDILSMYLERVYFGNGNYGLEAAARDYFGKSYAELTLYESALLVGTIKAPSYYNPAERRERAEKRAKQVLLNMVDADKIDKNTALSTINNPDRARKRRSAAAREFDYFADWVKPHVKDYIGKPDGEYLAHTTLDSDVQKAAHYACDKHVNDAMKNYSGLNLQCAVVALDKNGGILAMIGGRSYGESSYNRAVQAKRQPGSLFKLFVYAAAMRRGMTPYDVMNDKPVTYNGWTPGNWNGRHDGLMTLQKAFALSVNSVAVQLAEMIGVENVIAEAKKLGVTEDMKPNLSIALGTSEASLLEMTNAYAHISGGGSAVWPHGLEKIVSKGEEAFRYRPQPGLLALDEDVVDKMIPLLRAVVTSGTGRKAGISGAAVAGKTGTSQNNRDAWFIGFTPDITVGVWTGRDDNKSMPSKISGGSVPAEIFHDVVSAYYNVLKRDVLPQARLYDDVGRPPVVTVAPKKQPRNARDENEDGFIKRLWDTLRGR